MDAIESIRINDVGRLVATHMAAGHPTGELLREIALPQAEGMLVPAAVGTVCSEDANRKKEDCMRDFHLRFALDSMRAMLAKKHDGWYHNPGYEMFNLLEHEPSFLPQKRGAYVLGTADNTLLTYPWGMSPVYYIGKAENLRNRIEDHANRMSAACDDHSASWSPRDQYGAAFGSHCVWYRTKKEDPHNVEAKLMESFFLYYGALPAANHKWSVARDE